MQRTTINRRSVLAVGAGAALSMPFIRPSWAQAQTVRALMWEAYVLPDLVSKFEQDHNVKFVATFFDGNSEAYNKLRVGGMIARKEDGKVISEDKPPAEPRDRELDRVS